MSLTEDDRKFAARDLENVTVREPKAEKSFNMNEFERLNDKTKKGIASDEEEKRFEEIIPIFAKRKLENEGYIIRKDTQKQLFRKQTNMFNQKEEEEIINAKKYIKTKA